MRLNKVFALCLAAVSPLYAQHSNDYSKKEAPAEEPSPLNQEQEKLLLAELNRNLSWIASVARFRHLKLVEDQENLVGPTIPLDHLEQAIQQTLDEEFPQTNEGNQRLLGAREDLTKKITRLFTAIAAAKNLRDEIKEPALTTAVSNFELQKKVLNVIDKYIEKRRAAIRDRFNKNSVPEMKLSRPKKEGGDQRKANPKPKPPEKRPVFFDRNS